MWMCDDRIVVLTDGSTPDLRRSRGGHRRRARPRRDGGTDRARMDGDHLHLLHARGRSRAGGRRCRRFDHGRLVVNVVEMPIKCPVAPLEFCFLADWFLRERGVRDAVELTYVTPLDGGIHQAGSRPDVWVGCWPSGTSSW